MLTEQAKYLDVPDEELIGLFFSNGGEICSEQFTFPADKNNDAHKVLEVMFERSSTRKMLHELQQGYRKGKVDRFGRSI